MSTANTIIGAALLGIGIGAMVVTGWSQSRIEDLNLENARLQEKLLSYENGDGDGDGDGEINAEKYCDDLRGKIIEDLEVEMGVSQWRSCYDEVIENWDHCLATFWDSPTKCKNSPKDYEGVLACDRVFYDEKERCLSDRKNPIDVVIVEPVIEPVEECPPCPSVYSTEDCPDPKVKVSSRMDECESNNEFFDCYFWVYGGYPDEERIRD